MAEQHDQETNRPPVPLRVPNRERHMVRRVRQRTPTRSERNSVVESWVDMDHDIEAINRGEGVRQGSDYRIHGRRYRSKSGANPGGSYPVDGDGVHGLSRAEFKALGLYNELGDVPRLDEIFANMNLSTTEREAAYRLWKREKGTASDVD